MERGTKMQLELFDETETMSEVELEKQKAKSFVTNNIYHSAGHKRFIKNYLDQGDVKNAYQAFRKAFLTYGFGYPGSYAFRTYKNRGEIRYFTSHKQAEHIYVDSQELFEVLLEQIK